MLWPESSDHDDLAEESAGFQVLAVKLRLLLLLRPEGSFQVFPVRSALRNEDRGSEEFYINRQRLTKRGTPISGRSIKSRATTHKPPLVEQPASCCVALSEVDHCFYCLVSVSTPQRDLH